ncbi:TetR/AcrR family transcriptional regulator [Branchiibius sp. NY16-3462-2]|uniref:TetR/AcrR family transcriptional regulator n=1 Tax=Branchiibius sp. NY16-3462-2 TaxID=1807500 RepID=UPI000791D4C2|nr:TetR family transcriptional regulator [Branchiibius sp. NY16-3462-2]KYH43265.1 hypothetical protein AZH51_13000 [Branchiibius sp. NY16-3462-2]
MSQGSKRRGRPAANAGDGRERILAAARNQFATNGFRAATLRSIAGEADVDVALIAHHFGSKMGLFAASLQLPERSHGLLVSSLDGPTRTQGRRLTAAYLSLWEDPQTGPQMQAIVRAALADPEASSALQNTLIGLVADPDVQRLLEGRRTGFFLAMSHLVGLAILRYVVQLPDVARANLDELTGRVAPVVQRHLTTADS